MSSDKEPGSSETPSSAAAEHPNGMQVMSWNIGGLDARDRDVRTLRVCQIILEEDPDVVYLQEVVPSTLSLLQERCPGYSILPGVSETARYFTAMMLKATSVTLKNHQVLPFHTSGMKRNLLKVEASVKGVNLTLLTSHLESTAEEEAAAERKKQLGVAFQELKDAAAGNTVIFGGDLNMRDRELRAVGGIPNGTYDVWEAMGKKIRTEFTWDLVRNDNLDWPFQNRPKCRFDRLYVRDSQPKPKLKPVYFGLVGLQRLESCRRFPSDHWGLVARFNMVDV